MAIDRCHRRRPSVRPARPNRALTSHLGTEMCVKHSAESGQKKRHDKKKTNKPSNKNKLEIHSCY